MPNWNPWATCQSGTQVIPATIRTETFSLLKTPQVGNYKFPDCITAPIISPTINIPILPALMPAMLSSFVPPQPLQIASPEPAVAPPQANQNSTSIQGTFTSQLLFGLLKHPGSYLRQPKLVEQVNYILHLNRFIAFLFLNMKVKHRNHPIAKGSSCLCLK